MLYNQPFDQPTNPNAPYVNGNPSTGIQGSIPAAAAIEFPQREIVNFITDSGLTPSNSDLHQASKAVQSGKVFYGVDTSTTLNSVVTTLTPAPDLYREGMHIRVKMANSPTGPNQINCNGLGFKTIVTSGAAAILQNAWQAGDIVELTYDGTNFQAIGLGASSIGGISFLSGPKDIYVGGTGASDSNDGFAATVTGGHGPFATVQKALNQLSKYNLNGYNVTIHIAAGTYVGGTAPIVNGSGIVSILGPNRAAPSQVTLTTTGAGAGLCALSLNNGNFYLDGFTVQAAGTSNYDGINCTGGSCSVQLGNINFGTCGRALIFGQAAAQISADTNNGSILTINTAVAFQYGFYLTTGASLGEANPPGAAGFPSLVFAGGPVNFGSFITAQQNASTNFLFSSISGTGGIASGNKYLANMNGVINTNGSGVNYYPGVSAGSTASGGQYV